MLKMLALSILTRPLMNGLTGTGSIEVAMPQLLPVHPKKQLHDPEPFSEPSLRQIPFPLQSSWHLLVHVSIIFWIGAEAQLIWKVVVPTTVAVPVFVAHCQLSDWSLDITVKAVAVAEVTLTQAGNAVDVPSCIMTHLLSGP